MNFALLSDGNDDIRGCAYGVTIVVGDRIGALDEGFGTCRYMDDIAPRYMIDVDRVTADLADSYAVIRIRNGRLDLRYIYACDDTDKSCISDRLDGVNDANEDDCRDALDERDCTDEMARYLIADITYTVIDAYIRRLRIYALSAIRRQALNIRGDGVRYALDLDDDAVNSAILLRARSLVSRVEGLRVTK